MNLANKSVSEILPAMLRALTLASPAALAVGLSLDPLDSLSIRSQPLYHSISDSILTPLVRAALDGEQAHELAVTALKYNLTPTAPNGGITSTPSPLAVSIPSRTNNSLPPLKFRNCVGLAAGFDKDGAVPCPLLQSGFGSVEIGSVTPEPQSGNPKPRVFRLPEDGGVINRYGFNSKGGRQAYENLVAMPKARAAMHDRYSGCVKDQTAAEAMGVVGVNLGKNKLTEDALADYSKGIQRLGVLGEYIVVNVSSPNTPGLRGLQEKSALLLLLAGCVKERNAHAPTKLLFVKIAPDLTGAEMKDIAGVLIKSQVDGVIISNTTNSRPESLVGESKGETGGLSGRPVRELSTEVIKVMYGHLNGVVPIIGAGGVSSGQDAYDKIKAGAVSVQLYSALTYEGLGLVERIKKDLLELLERDGFKDVKSAVGAGTKK